MIINNKNLSNYIMFKLDKTDNNFTVDELNRIDELVIDYNNETENNFIFLEELLKLNNLKTLTLRNAYIYNDNYSIFLKLHKLENITFDNCEFENADLIASLKLKSLSLINCNINSYNFINILENLQELTIINGIIEISKINKLKKLNYLQLSYTNIVDNNEININSLKELYIDNTNINNFNFINNLTNLNRISIDEEQYKKNKELFDLLKVKINVLNENMVEFGGEEDDF